MHDRKLIASSLRDRACDLAGIGRPACLQPQIPRKILLNREVSDEAAVLSIVEDIPGSRFFKWLSTGSRHSEPASKVEKNTSETPDPYETSAPSTKSVRGASQGVPLVGASISILWHEMQINRIGRGVQPNPDVNWLIGLWVEFIWWGLLSGGPLGWYNLWTN